MDSTVDSLVDNLFRRESGRLVAVLARMFGAARIDLAEDVAQETLAKALLQWRYKGVPENPSAWLYRVAKNHALDLLRRDSMARSKQPEMGRWAERVRCAVDDERRCRDAGQGHEPVLGHLLGGQVMVRGGGLVGVSFVGEFDVAPRGVLVECEDAAVQDSPRLQSRRDALLGRRGR